MILYRNAQIEKFPGSLTESSFANHFDLPANFFTEGKHLKIKATGYYSLGNAKILNLNLRLNNINIIGSSYTPVGQEIYFGWRHDINLICVKTGVMGALRASGLFLPEKNYFNAKGSAANITIDTTIPQTIKFYVQSPPMNEVVLLTMEVED